ncbi:MAG: hypothetical protein V2A69_13295 [Pseudomonadota bacterium]
MINYPAASSGVLDSLDSGFRRNDELAASSGVLDSLDSGFRRNDELAASGGEYNPKRFKMDSSGR